jgi:hypothetical protein
MTINWAEVITAVMESFFTHSFSVTLGNGTLTAADSSGKPVTLTAKAIIAAAVMAYEGVAATVQCGDIVVTYTPNNPVTSA